MIHWYEHTDLDAPEATPLHAWTVALVEFDGKEYQIAQSGECSGIPEFWCMKLPAGTVGRGFTVQLALRAAGLSEQDAISATAVDCGDCQVRLAPQGP